MIIDEPNTSFVRPSTDNENVIFVTESRWEFQTIAAIDLCETPDTSFTRPQQSNRSATQSLPSKSPEKIREYRNGRFGFDEILSTFFAHLFYNPCIRNVIKTRKKCPVCNRSQKQHQVHRIFLEWTKFCIKTFGSIIG